MDRLLNNIQKYVSVHLKKYTIAESGWYSICDCYCVSDHSWLL